MGFQEKSHALLLNKNRLKETVLAGACRAADRRRRRAAWRLRHVGTPSKTISRVHLSKTYFAGHLWANAVEGSG